MLAATAWDYAVAHVLSFGLGVALGLALASRYRITRARPPNTTDDGE